MKPFHVKQILFSGMLFFSACGSDTSKDSTAAVDPNAVAAENDLNIDRTAIAALSATSGKCDNSYLVKGWHLDGSSDFVQVKSDCLFESFACGAVGYINSDVNMQQSGFADIVIVALENPLRGTHCMPKGSYRCSFDTRGMTGYLQLACYPK